MQKKKSLGMHTPNNWQIELSIGIHHCSLHRYAIPWDECNAQTWFNMFKNLLMKTHKKKKNVPEVSSKSKISSCIRRCPKLDPNY
jgi:hypothetical protein